MFVFISIDWKSSDHNGINNPATFLGLLSEVLLFCHLDTVAFFFGWLQGFHNLIFESFLPVLVHELFVTIDYGV